MTMSRHLNFRLSTALSFVIVAIPAAPIDGQSIWRAPSNPAVQVSADGVITNSAQGEYELTSVQDLKADPGAVFEVKVRIKVDLHTRALPELASYDAAGKEIPGRSSLAMGPGTVTPNWLEYSRFFPAAPGAASVRAKIRGSGGGQTHVAELGFRPAKVDPYGTGALISQPYPTHRRGVMLESNLGIVNAEFISEADRDGDGKWAVIATDLDTLAKVKSGVDWRTSMEYNPNLIYWSDGVTLKSDSIKDDRSPDVSRALHFRMKAHAGPYRVTMNDPSRAVAISLDGKTWSRHEGGREADLGVMAARDGIIEFWLDACYRDAVNAGPVYFDYVRLMPEDVPDADERLFQAARRKAPSQVRGSVEQKRVQIKVRAPQFAGGAKWPVRCGLPIPQGELATPSNVTVLDATGREVPSQIRIAGEWRDGSVKWLSLDFEHDFSTSGQAQYTVVYGNGVRSTTAPRQQVKVNKTAQGIEIDTGAIRFSVPQAKFGMVQDVRTADGRVLQAGPLVTEIAEVTGKVWHVPDAELQIETAGPLHTVIAAKAPGYRARIHAYAGSPLVQIDYFFANMDSRAKVEVKSIVVKAPVAGGGSGVVIAATADAKSPGWSSNGTIGVGLEAFREQYPKALRWANEGLKIDLWAPEGGRYEWMQGVGKTHRMALYYGKVAGDGALLANGAVLALATPEWYTASGVFGPIEPAAKSPLPSAEKVLAQHVSRRIVGEVGLGFENYGDHLSPAYVKGASMWIDNEYDVPAAAILGFVRTGDVDALRVGVASAQHYVDVDTIHFSTQNPNWIGGPHSHSHDTNGHHTSDAPNMSHAGFAEGLIWASYLTGDPDGLEGAKGIADWVLRSISPQANIGGMERGSGHPMMTLNDVYEATWDDRYLRGSAKLVDWVLRWEHPVHSGFFAPITESPAYFSGSSYNSGLLSAPLMKFNSWAQAPEVGALLDRFARHILTEMWGPGGIRSKGAAVRTPDPLHISSHLRLMRSEYLRTGNPLYLALPREMVTSFFEKPNAWMLSWAARPGFDADYGGGLRTSGLVFKNLPWFLSLLKERGDPRPGALQVRPKLETVEMNKGAAARMCFEVKNATASRIENWRVNFQPRLDFNVEPQPGPPAGLEPEQTTELCYEVRAPEKINLTLELNRVSYAHWTSSYNNAGQPGVAHAWTRIALK
jgi:hypothetical protein